MGKEDLVEEFNFLMSKMLALAQQGEILQKISLSKEFGRAIHADIFRELSDRAKFSERKKEEMLSTVEGSIAELEQEKSEIGKHMKILGLWRQRALARLGEVDAMRKKLTGLFVASEACSMQLSEQLLTTRKRAQGTRRARPEDLIGTLLRKHAESAAKEKLQEMRGDL